MRAPFAPFNQPLMRMTHFQKAKCSAKNFMCTMYESQELLIKLSSILYTLLTSARTRSRASAPSRPPAAPSHTSARTSAPSLSGPPPCPLAPTTTTARTANAQRPIAVPPRTDDHHRKNALGAGCSRREPRSPAEAHGRTLR